MSDKAPVREYTVRGRDWTSESLIIRALMRRLQVTSVSLTRQEMFGDGGIMYYEKDGDTIVEYHPDHHGKQ